MRKDKNSEGRECEIKIRRVKKEKQEDKERRQLNAKKIIKIHI